MTELETLTKEELTAKIKQLEAHVKQLKNVISKQALSNSNEKIPPKKNKEFDFNRFKKRHVALKILYFGWDYQGFVVQEDTSNTIEAELFSALTKTKLVGSREESNYHRCGRTDKGVSAFNQVISIDVRTNMVDGKGVFAQESYSADETKGCREEEIDFPKILNRVLPPEIRVIAWAPVDRDFSARFDCEGRSYRYYFPRGDLDIAKMKIGAKYLLGNHDFRNLCKMDVANGVVNYRREILAASISAITDESDGGYQLYELLIVGQAFLWHQIRCIVAILFLIGRSKETPEIILELLDIDKNPCKPQYSMASELPLVLYDCAYENVTWIYDRETLESLITSLQKQWTISAVKSVIIRKMLKSLEELTPVNPLSSSSQADVLEMGIKSKVYRSLLDRPTCESLEDRIKHAKKRKK